MLVCRRRFSSCVLMAAGASLLPQRSTVQAQTAYDFSRIRNYQPGSIVILPNLTFREDIEIEVNGTRDQPVLIKAVIPFQTKLHGRLLIKGSFAILEGLSVEGEGGMRIEGEGHLVRHCHFENGSRHRALTFASGERHIARHCSFRKWNNPGVAIFGATSKCRIESCLFDNRGMGLTRAAAVQLGLGDRDAYRNLEAVVDHCRFVGWGVIAGKDKVLTIKSSGNHIRCSTFEDCDARIQVRYGAFNTFEGCYLFRTRCLRVLDEGNRILGCLIRGSLSETPTERGLVVAGGNHAANSGNVNLPGSHKDGHPTANNTVIAGCDVDYTYIGSHYRGHSRMANATKIRQHQSSNGIHMLDGHHSRTDSRPSANYPKKFKSWTYLTDGEVGPRL